ncbi:MAG: helix-turn-helix transcriptional regulator [Labrys sp. (in: a-proteobacteria)]|jgi:hypothetical protein
MQVPNEDQNISLLTTERAIELIRARWGISYRRAYLNKLRSTGGGPGYRRIGLRVVYPVSEIEAWVSKRSSPVVTKAADLPSWFD